jgi:four helix bundle protein
MGFIVQQKALQAAEGLRGILPVLRKRDKDLFDQVRRAMNSVVLNIAEANGNDAGTAKARFATACGSAKEVRAGLQLAEAYGYLGQTRSAEVDIALDEVCAMSWRLSGR